MNESVVKFVIVGHVDHGKSTLIGRLLYDTNSLAPDKIEEIKKTSKDLGRETEFSYLLDHLEEERQQGITIETTQVFFKTDKREYIIIDAPGHVEFLKNMITGASQAEAAVLIIDVNEGIKEQTKRHAYILSLLGLKQVIVALNKMDMVGYNQKKFNQLRKNIKEFLDSIGIKPLACIPISALKGENITKKSKNFSWYKGYTFLESLDILKNKESAKDKPLIFPVQDVYLINDKRIIVGRIEAGSIIRGQSIEVLPSGEITKVQSIEKYPQQYEKLSAGECLGITLEDDLFINRGDIICETDPDKQPILTDKFYANIFWLAKNEFRKEERLNIRCATQETTCKIESIKKRINSSSLEIIEKNADKLQSLEVGEVIIKTKKPIAIKNFNDVEELGRFVLVQNENICAGGIISKI